MPPPARKRARDTSPYNSSNKRTAPKTPHVPLPNPLPALPPLPAGELSTAPFLHSSRGDAKYARNLNYERLEFYGDAVLELLATKLIFHRFPALQPGRQSQLRETLVRNSTLATYARAYGFRERISASHEQFGPGAAEKTLADCFEAYIAAMCLAGDVDGKDEAAAAAGEVTAGMWMRTLWAPLVDSETRGMELDKRNWKQELHEALVGHAVRVEYREQGRSGEQDIDMAVVLNGWGFEDEVLGRGWGRGKVDAGMKAARDALVNNARTLDVARERRRKHLERRRREKEEAEAAAAA